MVKQPNNRPFNFGAGPSMLPTEILVEARQSLLNWRDSGMSVMEVGHRTPLIRDLFDESEVLLRDLLSVPDNYHVLFLGHPARTQFSMIPMNLISSNQSGAYIDSGIWSSLAFDEAKKISRAYCIASSQDNEYRKLPTFNSTQVKPHTAYLYYTPNETINGLRYAKPPEVDVPLVADMTSCILYEPINVKDYGLIFAGAQKNISIAGLTIVIVNNNLIQDKATTALPSMMDYRLQIESRSLYATPSSFNCYLALLMFRWLKKQGGVEAQYQLNSEKSTKLYDFIDNSSFYHCNVEASARSIVNICFSLADPTLEPLFIDQAAKHGLLALKGHRLAGGCRASLYNSMPIDGVNALIAYMQQFQKEHQ
jgi:phosphoserine aminotransferase